MPATSDKACGRVQKYTEDDHLLICCTFIQRKVVHFPATHSSGVASHLRVTCLEKTLLVHTA